VRPNDIDDALTARLADAARAVGRIDAAGVTETVVRRARRKQRRRSMAAIASVAVLAAAVAVSFALADAPLQRRAPATGGAPTAQPTVSPSPSSSAKEREVVSHQRLARWVDSLPVRDELPVFTGDVPGLLRIEHTAGFTGAEDYEARVLLAGRELIRGEVTGAAMTADGTRLAVSVDLPNAAADGLQTTVLVADVASGRVLARQTRVARHAAVVGWADETVVLGVPNVYSRYGRTLTWVPGSAVRSIPVAMPLDVAESGDRIVVGTSNCSRVFDLRTGEFITAQRCDDARLVAITDAGDVAVTPRLELVDVAGGAGAPPALALPGLMSVTQARVSRDGQVVFTVEWRDRGWHEATIACPANGNTCARVRDARPATEAVHVAPPLAKPCDPELLRWATAEDEPTTSPVANREAAGPYGFFFARLTTVQGRSCSLTGFPELLNLTPEGTVRLTPRHGTVFPGEDARAVIRPGIFATATVQTTSAKGRPICPASSRRTYSELRLDVGNGTTILLGRDVRTWCPLRLGAWRIRD